MTKCIDKKHSLALTLYPSNIIPLDPVDGADNQFGQLNKQTSGSPYIQACIDGFKLPQPFQVSKHYLTTQPDNTLFHWPTLAEMNSELFPNNVYKLPTKAADEKFTILYTGPPPVGPSPYTPTIPLANGQTFLSLHSNWIGRGPQMVSGPGCTRRFDVFLSLVSHRGLTFIHAIPPNHGITQSTSITGFATTTPMTCSDQHP